MLLGRRALRSSAPGEAFPGQGVMTKIVELIQGHPVDLDRLYVVSGKGELPKETGEVRCCVRTARAWALGQSHSDVLLPGESAVVRSLEIAVNDGVRDELRQKLKAHVARLPVPYVSDALELRRAVRVCDWYVRTFAATVFELLEEEGMARELRELPALDTQEAWKAAEPVIALALARARALARALALALARDLALARARDLALDLDLDLDRARDLEESALALLEEIVAIGVVPA